MAGPEDPNPERDQDDDTTPGDAELGDDLDPDAIGDEGDDDEPDEESTEAASSIELVILPIACTNAGKGAPLAMGVQRWWAQELAGRGGKAAAPVFTAMAESQGRKVPALMVFRESWTDERAHEGISRFPNAKRGLVADLHVDDDGPKLTGRLVRIVPAAKDAPEGTPGQLEQLDEFSWQGKIDELPTEMLSILRRLATQVGVEIDYADTKAAFRTSDAQALTSFLVGLGNLSALQGRCVPTTPEQMLSPFMDAIGRDPAMEPAVQGLHVMVDLLVRDPADNTAIPLALQALNMAAQKRKNDAALWHHLATLLRQLGDLGSAVQAFNQAFNLDPTDAAVTNAFVQTLRGAGDRANALKVAQFAAERGNEDPRLFAHLGSLMIEADQFDEAEPFLRRAVEEGKVASAYGDLANVMWDRGDADDPDDDDRKEALSLLRTAVDEGRLAKSILDMLLDLHEEEKNEEATVLLLRAAEKVPGSATVLRYVATMYLDGDDPPKARDYLEKILALPRRSLDDDAFARRGRLQLDIDDFDEHYDAAIEGVRSGDAKRLVEAAKFLRTVVAKDDQFWQPHLMLALAVRESEGDEAALAHLGRAVRLRPNDPEIRNLIAAIHRRAGRPQQAIEHLRAVVALSPREVEPVVALATVLRDANQFAQARQVCQAALQMMPKHPEFKRILDSLPAPGPDEAEDEDGDEQA